MPEGPEVTVHAERIHAACRGQRICRADIWSGRYQGSGVIPGRQAPPAQWATLQEALPATLESVSSKGKFMWMRLSSPAVANLTLWSTLGMTGAWSEVASEHARVVLELSDADGRTRELYYNDQRNFGSITVCTDEAQLHAKLASLGPSWLEQPAGLSREAFNEVVARQCARKRSAAVPVAKFLMDQSKTCGIGNYILSETLYLARVFPWAACGDLDSEAWSAVHAAAADVCHRSYTSQRALAASQASGALSATRGTTFTFRLHVYRQARTAEGLAVLKAEGPHKRSVFWVPSLQVRGRPADGPGF